MANHPSSVSSDLIGIAAMRCVGLLNELGVDDRSGSGRVIEVYPAVALSVWGFASRGYKPRASRGVNANLGVLFQALTRACPWLSLSDAAAHLCSHDDDAFDALIAALVARVAALDLTMRPTDAEADRAKLEGWIAVPLSGSLGKLAP